MYIQNIFADQKNWKKQCGPLNLFIHHLSDVIDVRLKREDKIGICKIALGSKTEISMTHLEKDFPVTLHFNISVLASFMILYHEQSMPSIEKI